MMKTEMGKKVYRFNMKRIESNNRSLLILRRRLDKVVPGTIEGEKEYAEIMETYANLNASSMELQNEIDDLFELENINSSALSFDDEEWTGQ